jgi:hypothetical protein
VLSGNEKKHVMMDWIFNSDGGDKEYIPNCSGKPIGNCHLKNQIGDGSITLRWISGSRF